MIGRLFVCQKELLKHCSWRVVTTLAFVSVLLHELWRQLVFDFITGIVLRRDIIFRLGSLLLFYNNLRLPHIWLDETKPVLDEHIFPLLHGNFGLRLGIAAHNSLHHAELEPDRLTRGSNDAAACPRFVVAQYQKFTFCHEGITEGDIAVFGD